MVLVAKQVKRRRGTTAENDAFTGAEGEIVVDTERHELRVHDGVTRGGFRIGGGSGSGYNTGDTFLTKRTDTNLAGAVECDGATYNTTDFTGNGSIGELLEAGKLDYISLSAYSTAIAQTGWCDKIGWDGAGNTVFRVPTLNAHIVQTNNIPVVGNGRILKLGNSPSTATSNVFTGAQSSGAFPLSVATGFSANQEVYYPTDGAQSGMIADTTDTAQLRVMIQIANGATDEALETCTGVLADVAGLKDHRVIEFQAPTSSNNYTWYRKYADGWVEQGGTTSLPNATDAIVATLPIEMADTNYSVAACAVVNDGTWISTWIRRNSTTQIRVDMFNASGDRSKGTTTWQVSGMSAQ